MNDGPIGLLFDHSLAVIVTADEDGRFIEASQAACEMFGYSQEQMLLKRIGSFVIPGAEGSSEEHEGYSPNEQDAGEFRFVRPDREMRVVSYSACPLAAGQHLSILRDITERKHSEEALRDSEARFHGLADNIAQLAWIADGSGWIFWYNRRWFDYTGTVLADMQGWGWDKVHHPDHIERVIEKFTHHLQTGEPWEDTFPLRAAEGHYRWFLSRAAPVRNEASEITFWFGTNTDVTEQCEAEEELRERQTEIECLNKRLRRAMTETHHRVKNDLQVISAIIEMEATNGEPTEPNQRLTRHVQALAMIHDLLTAQSKSDDPDTSRVSVQTVLERLVFMLNQSVGDRRIQAHIEEVYVTVEKSASLALLVNECVSNALKHGSGDIDIVLRTYEEGARARLEVRDNGSGFPPGFNAVRSAHTGLELIDVTARWDLRGDVSYENRPVGGACVIITFPLSA